MLATLLTVFALQQVQGGVYVGSSGAVVKVRAIESNATPRDSTRSKAKKRISATDRDIATAVEDAGARSLVRAARAARMSQDSSIASYEASTLQRFTVGLAFSRIGRERILFRTETASRTRWARGVGAEISVTGKRSAAPIFGGTSEVDLESVLSPVPYYPGRDAFWIGLGQVKEFAEEDDVVDPLVTSAEAYYTYRTGDSITFRLPDGTSVQLRELEVRPRKPSWQAVVGSLWFDARTGQLVRAAYRMSQAISLLDDEDDKPGFMARAILSPAEASVDGVAIEYGFYQGRYWLPRSEVLEGRMHVGFARMPMRIEEKFSYASINSLDTLPAMRDRRPLPDAPATPGLDSVHAREARSHFRDSVMTAREKAECAATGKRSLRTDRYNRTLALMVLIPCDTAALAHSAALPPSIFDAGEEVFGDAERDALLDKARTMMPNVTMIAPRPKLEYGFNLLRYNRVEGLSAAVDITQEVGPGIDVRFSPRMGTADRVFNAELALTRTNGVGSRSLAVYRRLNAANDWGHPLSFGAGASALLFGRDEGFYYRSSGVELAGDNLLGRSMDWRVFTERQSDAVSRTNVTLPRLLGSSGFGPAWNIDAARVSENGASLRKVANFGLDPNGFRLLSDLRLEGAAGTRDYGRGALDLTVSHRLFHAVRRDFSASVTAGAGTSAGDVPVQRFWYLGGTNSVRGQPAGAMYGSSYWLTRSEVGYGAAGFRRAAFFDLGWAGDRTRWSEMGRPASGVGLGWSFMDGLIRADVAHGIYPTRQWHSALYLDARF